MHIYMAAVYSNQYRACVTGGGCYPKLNDREKSFVDNIQHILESWHYVNKQRFVDDMRADNAKIFLDSGAFSAHTLGVQLSVTEYCDYIQRNLDIIRIEDGIVMASVLDGIGDPLKTYQNQLEMESRGVRPLPCFHVGEDERYLEWYIKNYEYITLGGMVGIPVKRLCVWLDRIWGKYLTDGSGNARLKVHGFGITSIPVMQGYPWYSCDSSSWIQSAAFGSIISPDHGPLSISEKSPSRHVKGQHVSTLTPIEQKRVLEMFERQGFTYERLSTVYESRAAYNLWSFGVVNKKINELHSEKIRKNIQEELF